MALTRTWYTDADVAFPDVASASTIMKSFFFNIKELLVGNVTGLTGSNGPPPSGSRWTVEGSSDSISSNMTGTDTWSTFANVIRAAAGVAHSWIVLKSPTALDSGTSWYICIDISGASDTAPCIYSFSKTAYTGGSITARPTSTKESNSGANQPTLSLLTVGAAHKMTRITDSAGNFWILHVIPGGSTGFHNMLMINKLINAPSGDLHQVIMLFDNVATGRGVLSGTTASTAPWNYSTSGGSAGPMQRSSDGLTALPDTTSSGIICPNNNSTNFFTATFSNLTTGKQDGIPCIISNRYSTNTKGGYRGVIPDCFVGNTASSVGTTSPATGTPELVNVGYFWIPNGSLSPTI